MENLTEIQKEQIALLLFKFGQEFETFRADLSHEAKTSSLCTVLLSLFAQFCEDEGADADVLFEFVSFVFRSHLKVMSSEVPVM